MLVGANVPRYAGTGSRRQTFARMLFYTLFNTSRRLQDVRRRPRPPAPLPVRLQRDQATVSLGAAASKHAAKGTRYRLQHTPLLSHTTYRRERFLPHSSMARSIPEGMCNTAKGWRGVPLRQPSAFFVTLNKDDKKHSATTMYQGLRHQSGAVPLGIAEQHVALQPGWSALLGPKRQWLADPVYP